MSDIYAENHQNDPDNNPTADDAKLLPSMRHYLNLVKSRQITGFGPVQESYEYVEIPLWQLRQWIEEANTRPQPAPQEGEPDFVKLSEMFADEVTERERAGASSDDVIKCLGEFGERMYRLGVAARPKVEDAEVEDIILLMRARADDLAAKLAEREAELAKADAVIAEYVADDVIFDAEKEPTMKSLDNQREAQRRHAARQQQKASAEPTGASSKAGETR